MPTTTNYIWDDDNLLAEADGTAAINTVYTNEPQRYGNLLSTRKSSSTAYHCYDALASTRQFSNIQGHNAGTCIYDAWGNVLVNSATAGISLLWNGEIGYYFDIETGQTSIRARFYSPVIARWTSRDPAPDSFHVLYIQSLNSPSLLSDPSGLEPSDCTGMVPLNCVGKPTGAECKVDLKKLPKCKSQDDPKKVKDVTLIVQCGALAPQCSPNSKGETEVSQDTSVDASIDIDVVGFITFGVSVGTSNSTKKTCTDIECGKCQRAIFRAKCKCTLKPPNAFKDVLRNLKIDPAAYWDCSELIGDCLDCKSNCDPSDKKCCEKK